MQLGEMDGQFTQSELSAVGLGEKVIVILIANEYLFFKNLLFWLPWVYYTAVYKNKSAKTWHIADCFLDAERNAGGVSICSVTNEAALAPSTGVCSGKTASFLRNQELNLKITTVCCRVRNTLTWTYPEREGSACQWHFRGSPSFRHSKSRTRPARTQSLPSGRMRSVVACGNCEQ